MYISIFKFITTIVLYCSIRPIAYFTKATTTIVTDIFNIKRCNFTMYVRLIDYYFTVIAYQYQDILNGKLYYILRNRVT